MDLEELIDSIDIVEYISQFVELEEKNGEYWGLSPFPKRKHRRFQSAERAIVSIASQAELEETYSHSRSSIINAIRVKL